MLKVSLSQAGVSVGSHQVHYAWVIVAVASAMWMITSTIRVVFSVLVPYLADDTGNFGWSYGVIAFAVSLQWIISGLFSPLAGWVGDRYGIRRTMVIGALLFTTGMLLTGSMSHLWQFYLYFGFVLGASIAVFQVPLVAAVTMWFKKRLGVAMGTLQASAGVGSAASIFFVVLLLDHLGFKWTFWIPGIVGGAALLLLIKPFHNEPGAIGLRPVGAPDSEPVRRLQHGATARIRTSVFLRQAQRAGSFWNLVGLHFWGCVGHNILIVFLVAIAMDEGMSRGSAAGLYVTLTAVSTVFRFVVPVLADQLGAKRAMVLVFSMQTLPILILFVSQDVWAFYLFAILFGIGTGGENATFPIISRQYYGNAPIGTAYGWQVMGGGIGMALGPLLGGFLWDITGGYMAAMVLSFGASLAGLLSVVALPTTAHHLMPHWEDSLPPEARSSAPS